VTHGSAPRDEWDRCLAAVERFIAVRGVAPIPLRAVADGVAVGVWARDQQERYWAGQLPAADAARLETLPGWSWSGPAEQKWHRALAALVQYANEHGTTAIPRARVVGEIRLGEWVAAQRAGHGAGTLPPGNAARLAQVPHWRWTVDDERWERGLAVLRAHVERQGTATPSPTAIVDGFRLGAWVRERRAEHRAGGLPQDHVALLESLPGWRWSTSVERWTRGLQALLTYAERYGSPNPPQHARVDGFPVGQWVHSRRNEHARGTLSDERSAALEALPGWRWATRRQR
jgi:hypothetical protein